MQKAICENCGKEFEPYQRGAVKVVHLCGDCLATRIGQGQTKKLVEKIKKKALVLDLSDYPEIMERLTTAARENFRTVELQALAYIVQGLEARPRGG